MMRVRLFLAVWTLLLLVGLGIAQEPAPPLLTATGTVDKVSKDSVTIRPRGADGRFEKSVTLKLTGTTKVSTVTVQKRGGKPVIVQKDTDAKDLQPSQAIAVIYTTGATGSVLLSAVAQPPADK
jgi:hypothetical protein